MRQIVIMLIQSLANIITKIALTLLKSLTHQWNEYFTDDWFSLDPKLAMKESLHFFAPHVDIDIIVKV